MWKALIIVETVLRANSKASQIHAKIYACVIVNGKLHILYEPLFTYFPRKIGIHFSFLERLQQGSQRPIYFIYLLSLFRICNFRSRFL